MSQSVEVAVHAGIPYHIDMPSSSRNLSRAVFVLSLSAFSCAPHRVQQQPAAAPTAPTAPAAPAAPAAPMAGHDMSTMAGHDMSGMNMPELPATAGPGYTVADVRFMQNMIGHHGQAIVMAAKAPTHGASGHVLKLAQKIAISQRDEIVFMKHWLTERKQVVPTDSQSLAMMMPGMLTPGMMKQLEAAGGSEFDRFFLKFMIGHHEGAIAMVKDLFLAPPAGQDPEIFRFATDVDTDQRSEIYVMHELLDLIR